MSAIDNLRQSHQMRQQRVEVLSTSVTIAGNLFTAHVRTMREVLRPSGTSKPGSSWWRPSFSGCRPG